MRDPDTSRLARRILTAQALTSVGLALLGGALFGARSGLWVLAGGAIGMIANLYMTLAALRSVGGNAGLALRRLFTGQFVKVGLTVSAVLRGGTPRGRGLAGADRRLHRDGDRVLGAAGDGGAEAAATIAAATGGRFARLTTTA